jgi:hypothetical protein
LFLGGQTGGGNPCACRDGQGTSQGAPQSRKASESGREHLAELSDRERCYSCAQCLCPHAFLSFFPFSFFFFFLVALGFELRASRLLGSGHSASSSHVFL